MSTDFQPDWTMPLSEYKRIQEQSMPKIKTLVWESTKLMRGGESADCPMGEFRIAKYGHVVGVDFCVYLNGLFRKKCSSLEEAKAWAQQEYERRVRECLE